MLRRYMTAINAAHQAFFETRSEHRHRKAYFRWIFQIVHFLQAVQTPTPDLCGGIRQKGSPPEGIGPRKVLHVSPKCPE